MVTAWLCVVYVRETCYSFILYIEINIYHGKYCLFYCLVMKWIQCFQIWKKTEKSVDNNEGDRNAFTPKKKKKNNKHINT